MTLLLARNRVLLRPLVNSLIRFRQAASLLAKSARPENPGREMGSKKLATSKKKDPEPLIRDVNYQQSEKEFLANKKASARRYAVYTNEKPDQKPSATENNGIKSFLGKHSELAKSQADPIHLTILDEKKAERVAKSILSRTTSDGSFTRVFIDLHPGVCLVSKHLVEGLVSSRPAVVEAEANKLVDARLVMIEPMAKYSSYLEDLRANYGDKIEIETFRARPFDFEFMNSDTPRVRQVVRSIKRQQEADNSTQKRKRCIFLGIVPWNRMGFLTKLFTNFASDRCLFSLRSSTDEPHEFFLYIPELVMAKLVPEHDANYTPFRSAVSVYASQFLKNLEIIESCSADDFYPYPMLSTPHKFSMHPFDKLDLGKMHLVRLVFKGRDEEFNFARRAPENESTDLAVVPLKYLFYLFVQEMYQRPTYTLIKVLKDIFKLGKQSKDKCDLGMKDHEYIAKKCSDCGVNSYSAVRKLTSRQCLSVFNAIISDPNTSTFLNFLNNRSKSTAKTDRELHKSGRERSSYLKALIASNEQMKGQLRFPALDSKSETF